MIDRRKTLFSHGPYSNNRGLSSKCNHFPEEPHRRHMVVSVAQLVARRTNNWKIVWPCGFDPS